MGMKNIWWNRYLFSETFGERLCWDWWCENRERKLFPSAPIILWGLPHSPSALNQPPRVPWHPPSQVMGMSHNIQARGWVTTWTKMKPKKMFGSQKPRNQKRQSDQIEDSQCNDVPVPNPSLYTPIGPQLRHLDRWTAFIPSWVLELLPHWFDTKRVGSLWRKNEYRWWQNN